MRSSVSYLRLTMTSSASYFSFFFFFQAEDGIRDLTVTGVQTCALPILRRSLPLHERIPGYVPMTLLRDFDFTALPDALREAGADAWLLYDFRAMNPIDRKSVV